MLWGYVRQLDFFFTELYNICDNIPSTIILILISYVCLLYTSGLFSGQSGVCALFRGGCKGRNAQDREQHGGRKGQANQFLFHGVVTNQMCIRDSQ